MRKLQKAAAVMTALAAAMSALLPLGAAATMPAEPDDWFDDDFWYHYLPGDCNLDGEFNMLDVVTLQKYLLGTAELNFWQNADLNYDEKIDVFDLCLMKRSLLESFMTYSSAVYTSEDEAYQMVFSIRTDHRGHSDITVTWYDPDGDPEKTDSFTVEHGNPFTSDGMWTEEAVCSDQEHFWIRWGEASVTISWNDPEDGMQEITLDYPDRTRTLQTISQEIRNPSAPEISAVDLSAETYGTLAQKASVEISRNVFVNDTVGRVGSAICVEVDESIESYDVTLHYDVDELRWVPEQNLIVLAFDEQLQRFSEMPEIALDTDNHTITFSGRDDCYYVMVDCYQWYRVWGLDAGAYAYTVSDITQYTSDWERSGETGDIMHLADKEWARNNLRDGTFTVSTAEELASAVYYNNAFQDIRNLQSMSEIHIILENDIDLEGYNWAPLTAFNGELNGNGHTIRNLTLSGASALGFIRNAQNADIHDISFENASVTPTNTQAAMAGIVAARQELPYSVSFENVHVTGTMTVHENATYGGILGQGDAAFTDCSADVLINGTACTYLSSDERVTHAQIDDGEELITLTLDPDARTLTRTSDESISSYTLNIIRDGEQILARGFDNSETLDLTVIPDYTLAPGSYQIYVTAYKNGGYRRISNIVSYKITE